MLNKILEPNEEEKAFAKERQHTAQAFTLHAEWKDGRHAEGFAWAYYSGYRWLDDGGNERVILIFGPRALEIEGRNLGPLVSEIREGKLNLVREMSSSKQSLLRAENPDEPVIVALRSYPDVEKILNEIKGEEDDQTRHVRRAQR